MEQCALGELQEDEEVWFQDNSPKKVCDTRKRHYHRCLRNIDLSIGTHKDLHGGSHNWTDPLLTTISQCWSANTNSVRRGIRWQSPLKHNVGVITGTRMKPWTGIGHAITKQYWTLPMQHGPLHEEPPMSRSDVCEARSSLDAPWYAVTTPGAASLAAAGPIFHVRRTSPLPWHRHRREDDWGWCPAMDSAPTRQRPWQPALSLYTIAPRSRFAPGRSWASTGSSVAGDSVHRVALWWVTRGWSTFFGLCLTS
jgi:hypothetical protein